LLKEFKDFLLKSFIRIWNRATLSTPAFCYFPIKTIMLLYLPTTGKKLP